MRIGAFAEKYNMNVSAVRYYVERGLLTPQRRNNQYVFDDDCMKDMEKILRYKSFHFSLSEIELLFFLQKKLPATGSVGIPAISGAFEQEKTAVESGSGHFTANHQRSG